MSGGSSATKCPTRNNGLVKITFIYASDKKQPSIQGKNRKYILTLPALLLVYKETVFRFVCLEAFFGKGWALHNTNIRHCLCWTIGSDATVGY